MARTTSAEDYKLLSGFEAVRKILLEEQYADRLDKPLAYWALPNDRRLPLAFLGRTVGELLNTPFDELASTPGIGQKKISSLVKLLHRATEDDNPTVPFGIDELAEENTAKPPIQKNGRFDPTAVSEAVWVQWRETVRKHEIGRAKLGRLAPTLQALPTVIWHTPLSAYLDLTLAEIRQLKTHGEKRVRVVLEVFHVVHEMLAHAGRHNRLTIRLVPNFVPPLEEWIMNATAGSEQPELEELRQNVLLPLLSQIETDAGPTVHKLAVGRLGIQAPPQSVRMQSRQMGVTRARVYQLLDDCSKVMEVRWPEGKHFLNMLLDKLQHEEGGDQQAATLTALRDLLYPEKYDFVQDAILA